MVLPLVRILVWGRLDRQPATGYLLEQFTMPWQGIKWKSYIRKVRLEVSVLCLLKSTNKHT